MTAITLQTVTEAAMAIQSCLTNGVFNFVEAQRKSDRLYSDALELVRAECNSAPLFTQDVLPVALTLDEVVPEKKIQHLDDLQSSLSKTYRVFIELTWHQCWRNKNRPVYSSDIQGLISNSDKLMKQLSKDQIATRFEYSCARQAARYLNPTDSIWNKYLELAPSAVGAGVHLSIGEMLGVLTKVIQYAKHDWMKGWYPDVRYLRWVAANVKTIKDFDDTITPELDKFKTKGDKFTQCLAAACFEVINNPQVVDSGCRERAAKELSSLLLLVDTSRVERFLASIRDKFPKSKFIGHLVQRADRYYKTREMVMTYLRELSQQNIHKGLLTLFKENLLTLKSTDKSSLTPEEIDQIGAALAKLEEENQVGEEFISDLIIQLQTTKGEEDDADKLMEAKGNLTIEQRDLIRRGKEIVLINSLQDDLKNVHNKEQKEIDELLNEIN
jgi:hypothetical protein